jgi:DNA (cytosine-5)-methyltransferase 1
MSCSSRESMILGTNYPNKYRLPTVREVASMMSFPIDYRFYGKTKATKYTLVGNAVPPKLSNALAKAISKKEGISVPKIYTRIQYDPSIEFYDLNGKSMPSKEEKRKRGVAKFKYHIPYLIQSAYRVELTNYDSKFKNKRKKYLQHKI